MRLARLFERNNSSADNFKNLLVLRESRQTVLVLILNMSQMIKQRLRKVLVNRSLNRLQVSESTKPSLFLICLSETEAVLYQAPKNRAHGRDVDS